MTSRHQRYYNKAHADYVCATAAQKAAISKLKAVIAKVKE